MNGWSLVLTGWPWWVAALAVALLVTAALRIQRDELTALAPIRKRTLRGLRAAAALLLVLPLCEPALAWTGSRSVPQRLVLLFDRSASMAACDPDAPPGQRLDEAVALGLLNPDQRADGLRRAAALLRSSATASASILAEAAELAAGTPTGERLRGFLPTGNARGRRGPDAPTLLALAVDLDRAQDGADAALVRTQEGPVATALDKTARLNRLERSRMLASRHLHPSSAQVETWAFASNLVRISGPVQAGGATTDLASALVDLARGWDRDRPGMVVVFGDGRQTAGPDPTGPARALAARGVTVLPVLIGDPGRPRDAVIAELTGAPEVFRGESVRLETRLRIVDDPARAWDLVFTRDGEEIERRPVRASGEWQTERLERPTDQAGTSVWRARLEPAMTSGVRGGGGLLREVWRDLPGDDLAGLRRPNREPDESASASSLVIDGRENYGQRLRGLVIAPQTGLYTFWISGDDLAELRLAPGSDPADLLPIATVPAATGRGGWDDYQAQRSQPVALAAGRTYALEILHRQRAGDGHVAVGWQVPDGRLERPLARERLAPPATVAASVDPAPEEASLINNQAALTVTVSDDPLRILLVDHQPRWDLRYAAELLERDRRVDLNARYAAVRKGHGRGVPIDPLLPATQEAWDSYDAVLLGDLSPVELGAVDQSRLRDYVGRRGGFLVVISGPRAMPTAFPLGPVADLLPVRPPLRQVISLPTTLTLGPDGADHPVARVLGDRERNRRLWPLLPALPWWLAGCTPKPGAQVLLSAENKDPVAVLGRYGAGRILWMGSDETWRWRDRLGDRVHSVFWLQAMRWGLAARLRGADARLQAALEPAEVEPGGRAELRVRSRNGMPQVQVDQLDDRGQPMPGSRWEPAVVAVADGDQLWISSLRGPQGDGLGEGRWRVRASQDGIAEERVLSVRARPSLEGIELGADTGTWDRIAAASKSRRLVPRDLAELGSELEHELVPRIEVVRRTWSLWDGWWLAALVAGVLGGEWWLRRRWGLP